MGQFPEYRALHAIPQSEKPYTKSTHCPLHAVMDRRQAFRLRNQDGAIWISQGEAPV
jgi:hypothetical protein